MKPHWYRDDEPPPGFGVLFLRLLALAAAILAVGFLIGCARRHAAAFVPTVPPIAGQVHLDMVATRNVLTDPLGVTFKAYLYGKGNALDRRCVSMWRLDFGDGTIPGQTSSACDLRAIGFSHSYAKYDTFLSRMTVTIDDRPYVWAMPVYVLPLEITQ